MDLKIALFVCFFLMTTMFTYTDGVPDCPRGTIMNMKLKVLHCQFKVVVGCPDMAVVGKCGEIAV